MAELPEITEIKRLNLRPGDRLVVRLDRDPDMAEADQIKRVGQAAVGEDIPVLVCPPWADLEVLGAEAGDTEAVNHGPA